VRIADVAVNGGGVSKAACVEGALCGEDTDITYALAKDNGRLLRAHLSRVAQASGRAYLRGLPHTSIENAPQRKEQGHSFSKQRGSAHYCATQYCVANCRQKSEKTRVGNA
jgi:hypothetical protein